MKKTMVMLLFVLTVFLTACRNNGKTEPETVTVYALNPEKTELVSRASDILPDEPKIIEKLMKALSESDGKNYVSAVSMDNSAPDWTFSEADGVLHITEFSLWSIDSPAYVRTLRKAAVVKTFSSVKEVREIRFGSDYPYYSIEKLTDDSLTESVPLDAVREKITVYYSNEIRTGLVPRSYYVNYGGNDSLAYLVLNRLIAGPGKDETGYVRTVSPDTRINSIVIKNAVCKVDLSREFLFPPSDVQPWISLKSVIDTLCELDGIQYVTFSIDESEDEFFYGFPLSELYNTESLQF